MSVYHLQDGKLVKLCEALEELIDDGQDEGQLCAFTKSGWQVTEEIEGVYTLYEPRLPSRTNSALRSYGYAFLIEGTQDEYPWTLLIASELGDYLEAMRLMQPLFTKAMLQEQEAYHYGQREREERQAR